MTKLILALAFVPALAIAAPLAPAPKLKAAVPLKVSSASALSDADRKKLVQFQAGVDSAVTGVANAATQTTNAATNLTNKQAAYAEFWTWLKANYSNVHDGSLIDAKTGTITGP